MNYFSPEQQAFQQTIRDFFEREVNPHIDEWEKARTFPGAPGLQALRRARHARHHLRARPTAAPASTTGGPPPTPRRCRRPARATASRWRSWCRPTCARRRCTTSAARSSRSASCGPSIAGEMVGAIGVSEPSAGSDVFSIRTTARRDGDFYVVNGRKIFITNGTQADYITLLTKTDRRRRATTASRCWWCRPTRPASASPRSSRRSATTRPTPPSWCSRTCACRSPTASARRASASSIR